MHYYHQGVEGTTHSGLIHQCPICADLEFLFETPDPESEEFYNND